MSKCKSRKLFSYNQIYAQFFFKKSVFLTFLMLTTSVSSRLIPSVPILRRSLGDPSVNFSHKSDYQLILLIWTEKCQCADNQPYTPFVLPFPIISVPPSRSGKPLFVWPVTAIPLSAAHPAPPKSWPVSPT
jgi:hypothetical protein